MLEKVWRKGMPLQCWWELAQPLWRTVWRLLKKLNTDLPYDPRIPLLGIYPKKNITQENVKYPKVRAGAALFTTARTWKQTGWPSRDKRIQMAWRK